MHDRANNLIHRALASANYHCILEPVGLCRDKKRPDGFSLYPYTEGKILAWDYTCRNTLANSYKKHTAVEVGYAAMDGEKDKYDNYKDLVNDNYYVVPIAHKTMGSWGSWVHGLQIVSNLLKIWVQESLKQQVKNGPSFSCSKAWAWIYKEEMPYV